MGTIYPDILIRPLQHIYSTLCYSPLLSESRAKIFHTDVATALYLANRTRSDIALTPGESCKSVKGGRGRLTEERSYSADNSSFSSSLCLLILFSLPSSHSLLLTFFLLFIFFHYYYLLAHCSYGAG